MSAATDKLVNSKLETGTRTFCQRNCRQSDCSDEKSAPTKDLASPPWIKDLITSRREKLVDIMNGVAGSECADQSPASGCCATGETRRPSPEAVTQPLSRHSCCCNSQGTSHCSCCSSSFSASNDCTKSAVHLLNTASRCKAFDANVPIVVGRSVSWCASANASDYQTTNTRCGHRHPGNSPVNCNARRRDADSLNQCRLTTHSPATSSIGLVATRRHQLVQHQLVQRQVSDSKLLLNNCKCDCRCSVIDKMKDDLSELLDSNGLNDYEMLIDCNRPTSVNSVLVDGSSALKTSDEDSEYEYGPGIVDKLKLKFMSISQQSQYGHLDKNKLKRCSSLENLTLTHDKLIYHQQQQQALLQHESRKFQANELLLQCSIGKKSACRSIAVGGNRANGNQLLQQYHRQYIQHHNTRNNYNKLSTVPVLKRAKSMETLIFQEDQHQVHQPPACNQHHHQHHPCNHQLSVSDNVSVSNRMTTADKNVVIIENPAVNCDRQRNGDSLNSTKSGNNNLTDHLDELPKPHTVKTYKRIFETSESGKCTNGTGQTDLSNKLKANNYKKVILPQNGVRRKPPVIRATNRSANLKTTNLVNNNNNNSGEKMTSNNVNASTPSEKSSPIINCNTNNNNTSPNKSANSVKPPIAPKRLSLIAKLNPPPSIASGPPIKTPRRKHLNGHANSLSQNRTNSEVNTGVINSSNRNEEKIIDLVKADVQKVDCSLVPKVERNKCENSLPLPTESTSQNGDPKGTKQTNASESTSSPKSVTKPIANIKPYSVSHKNNTLKVNSSINGHSNNSNNLVQENQNNRTSVSNNVDKEKNVKASCDLNQKSFQEDKAQMSQETKHPIKGISKNNSKTDENTPPIKSEDQVDHKLQVSPDITEVSKPSTMNSSNDNQTNNNQNNKLPTSSLWTQSGQKQSNSSTSMVFDFRGKDVKPNIAVQPNSFAFLMGSSKRSASKEGSNSLSSTSDDEDDNYTGSTEIPLPCGIVFSGENVRVGRGSLLSTRNKKLKIQFDDNAISLYEYPSEASLLEESISGWSNESIDNKENETNESVISSHTSNPNSSLSKLKTNLALGGSSGSGLASYKPTLLENLDSVFQLGVSRNNKITEVITKSDQSEDVPEDNEMIKPAHPNETKSWSTSSSASDLLF